MNRFFYLCALLPAAGIVAGLAGYPVEPSPHGVSRIPQLVLLGVLTVVALRIRPGSPWRESCRWASLAGAGSMAHVTLQHLVELPVAVHWAWCLLWVPPAVAVVWSAACSGVGLVFLFLVILAVAGSFLGEVAPELAWILAIVAALNPNNYLLRTQPCPP